MARVILNPAVTFALAVAGIFPWDQVIPMSIAQIAGAFTGAAIAALFYYPHFKVTGPDEGNCVGILQQVQQSIINLSI